MKRYLILILFLLLSFKGKTCGFYPGEEYYFYNLFYQTNIIPNSLYPFIRGNYRDNFYKYEDSLSFNNGNIKLWEKLSRESPEVKRYWDFIDSIDYIPFTYSSDSWDYNSIRINKDDYNKFIERGFKLYKAEKIKQLKQRYAYQIVKLMFYSGRFEDAIKFFDHFVEPLNEKNEIYYYTMNYIGGCYYRLNDYDKAAYYYILVFYNSLDKKTSAYTSYNFCTRQNYEGKKYIKTKKEREAYITLKSIRGFSDSFAGVEELFKLNPNSVFFELLFVRSLNLLEKETLPTVSIKMKKFPVIDEKNRKRINKLIDISEKMYKNRKSKDKDFWLLANSYLYFLKGKINKANLKLYSVKDKRFEKQNKTLSLLYKIFNWKEIGAKEEDFLYALINKKEILIRKTELPYNFCYTDLNCILLERIGHIYLKNNQLAKSFLLRNDIKAVERIFSLPLIDALTEFVKKPNKNKFENYLIAKRIGNKTEQYLRYVKGKYYLHNSQPETAMKYLDKYQSKTISWRIFSNNINEAAIPYVDYYGDVYEKRIIRVMTDSVCRASVFSFIKDDFSFYDLADYLIKLDSITNDPKQWKRKLAHYLLGNYYYNISNSGIYRYVLVNRKPSDGWRKFFYSPYRELIFTEDMIEDKSAYNMTDARYYLKLYFAFTKKAMEHYNMVLTLSNDKELNARTLFLMAKCELNDMYNSDKSYYEYMYDGTVNKKTLKYKKSFEKLKNSYNDTEFYKMIIRECSFFRYYCSL